MILENIKRLDREMGKFILQTLLKHLYYIKVKNSIGNIFKGKVFGLWHYLMVILIPSIEISKLKI